MHPAEDFQLARQMRRKFIMHVGPTNSGKTHHALRALAASKIGVYAGPLRLLAYEIWERLNLGQIAPLGATEEQMAAAAAFGPSMDNPFARRCNMITGEEQKIVGLGSTTITSCTVEMLQISLQPDVAVIDEIQMIADRDRGAGWTRAVLGLCAKEIHLCGEETAVPLIRELLKETGDEIVVNRYQRLTPLEVEEKSLEGDLSRVQKGDCIVAFSRTAIFSLKKQVEMHTGMRCAVVYGKLPPEIRSEQAALFNDPDSGYDVLIGSDAIGMGLNLKIRRVIFESVSKYDGQRGLVTLSVSQMKQIAGRAGRFGMHNADETPGGFVTTLRKEDLPILRKTLALQLPPLLYARNLPPKVDFSQMISHLPANATTETSHLALVHAGLGPSQGYFTLSDRAFIIQAPFPWRDRTALDAINAFIATYYERMHVDLASVMRQLGYLEMLENAETAMRSQGGRGVDGRRFKHALQLPQLETFHKILVAYMWLSFRNPVSYPSQQEAMDLKERLEHSLHWCLQEMTRYEGDSSMQMQKRKVVPIEFKTRREFASCVHHHKPHLQPAILETISGSYRRVQINSITLQPCDSPPAPSSFVSSLWASFPPFSFVRALPALPNSDPGAKPASLLGRSYTRRTADSFAVSVFGPRQLGSEAPIDDPRPLGRAARFQISQHRASSTPGFVRADKGDETQSRDGQGSVEGREILLSHQQLVPSSASSLSSSSTTPRHSYFDVYSIAASAEHHSEFRDSWLWISRGGEVEVKVEEDDDEDIESKVETQRAQAEGHTRIHRVTRSAHDFPIHDRTMHELEFSRTRYT
ncbi:ATP-dependent RNA helicase [Mycena venus]|uniref:RNA helicase n=1 Tax=Mycena venus TaxID=2733690 RepID=A0A8H7CXE9_9AGAR|nr:ATP-dependent RNA helicase [Mycena venus]